MSERAASERVGGSAGAKPAGEELELARKVLRIEAAAILGLVDRLDGDFERAASLAVELISAPPGGSKTPRKA